MTALSGSLSTTRTQHSQIKNIYIKNDNDDNPGGPEVKNLSADNAADMGSTSGPGRFHRPQRN